MNRLFTTLASTSAVALAAALSVAAPADAQTSVPKTKVQTKAKQTKEPQSWLEQLFSGNAAMVVAPETDDGKTLKSVGPREYSQAHIKSVIEGKGFRYGAPVFIKIYKKEKILELWMEAGDGAYKKFQSFDIDTINNSDEMLGPKTIQGNRITPEGAYEILASNVHTNTSFRQVIDFGYPNAVDRFHNRTGSLIRIHANRANDMREIGVSLGCPVMKNEDSMLIHGIIKAALQHGDRPFIYSFPFRMTAAKMAQYAKHKWAKFWQSELKPIEDALNATRRPVNLSMANGHYAVLDGTTPRDDLIARKKGPTQVAVNATLPPRVDEVLASLPAPSALGMKPEPVTTLKTTPVDWYTFSRTPLKYSSAFDGNPVKPFAAVPGSVANEKLSDEFSACSYHLMFTQNAEDAQKACAQAVADKFINPKTGEIITFKAGKGDSFEGLVPMNNFYRMSRMTGFNLISDETSAPVVSKLEPPRPR